MTDRTPDPSLAALLSEIDGLRLRLTADLGAAAGALDAEAPEVARDALAGAQDDVAVFSLRAERALLDAERTARPAAEPAEPLAPVTVLRPRAGRRLGALAPALTAAAALVAVLLGVVPATGPSSPGSGTVTSAAASYAELLRLHESGAPAPRLAAAARRLDADVARLVALAEQDPATAGQALRLLEREAATRQDRRPGEPLAPELAESQRLIDVLRAALGGTVLAGPVPGPLLPAPVRTPRATDGPAVLPPLAPAPAPTDPTRPAPAPEPAPAPALVPLAPPQAPAPAPASAPAEPAPAQPAPAPAPAEQAGPADDGPDGRPAASPSPETAMDPSDPRTWIPAPTSRSLLPGS